MANKTIDGMTLPETLDQNTVYFVYVDDDSSMALIVPAMAESKIRNGGIAEQLAGRGIKIEYVVFDNAVDALETLQTRNLHRVVVLSDNNMPLMNGTEFVSRLRDVDSSVPLAVLSALPKEAEKELADNVKDVRIFTKPAENSKAVTEHVIPNIIAAAEKPALPLKGDAKAAPAKPEPGKA